MVEGGKILWNILYKIEYPVIAKDESIPYKENK